MFDDQKNALSDLPVKKTRTRTLWNPAQKEEILSYCEKFGRIEACKKFGISKSTVKLWLQIEAKDRGKTEVIAGSYVEKLKARVDELEDALKFISMVIKRIG